MPSALLLNYAINSAVSADEQEEMLRLLMLATVLDIQIDLNTYWRLCFRVYDHTMPITVPETHMQVSSEQQKQLLVKIYTMLENDHGYKGLEFSMELIKNYYNTILDSQKTQAAEPENKN